MLENHGAGLIDRLPSSQLLMLAEQIERGVYPAAEQILDVEGQFVSFYERPFSENRHHRELISRAATALAGRDSGALDVVIDSARRYAAVQQNIDDADPYSPNSIEVLAGVPGCAKVVEVLYEIVNDRPGMAQSEAWSALAALGAVR